MLSAQTMPAVSSWSRSASLRIVLARTWSGLGVGLQLGLGLGVGLVLG